MAYVLFISEEKLKDSTSIYGSVETSMLLPFVKQAQKLYCETKLFVLYSGKRLMLFLM